jgi:spermidine/putrescine-binding protein
MKTSSMVGVLAVVLIASLALSACGGKSEPTATQAHPEKHVTSSGFECPEPEPRIQTSSTELSLLVWTQYIPAEMLECFELVYGIQIKRVEYSSNEDMLPMLAAPGSSFDVVQPSDYVIPAMVRDGMLQPLDKSRLPNLKNIDPNYLGFEFDPGNEYTIPYMAGTDALVANTERVETLPQSWADLWNPDYAGRMVFTDDARVAIGVTLLTLGFDFNSTDPVELGLARDKLDQLIPNIKLFDSDSPSTVLISGDVDLGVTWNGEALTAQRENPAIAYIFPTEGATIWQDNWAIPASAAHVDAAYAWLNYSMQGDLFWLMLRDFPYTNPNTAALEYARQHQPELYQEYIDSPITNTPVEQIRKAHRVMDVGDALEIYDAIWLELRGE